MSSYLTVTLNGRCSFVEIDAFEDGILAKHFLDVEHGLLHLPLAFQQVLLLRFFFLRPDAVFKKIQLPGGFPPLLEFLLRHHVVGGQRQAPNEQDGIGDAVEKVGNGLFYQTGG